MTDNEIIAMFDGATEFRTEDGVLYGYWPEHDEGNGEGWLDVTQYADRDQSAAWHGPGRLLEKIEEKLGADKWKFLMRLDLDNSWDALTATPAQLTTALVATIKEVENGS